MTAQLEAFEAFTTGTVVAAQPRDVVVVEGPDAASFLQSLISQDIADLEPRSGAHSLLLQPQGKLVADFRVLRLAPDEFWCVTERGVGEQLASGLGRFRIRVKVEIALDASLSVMTVRGAGSEELLTSVSTTLPAHQHGHVAWRGTRIIRSDWPDNLGFDLAGPPAELRAISAALETAGAVAVGDDVIETERVRLGMVRQGFDIDETTIAQEAQLEGDAVSFTKGCFVGQELVCRIDSRGHVNRFVRRLVFAGSEPAPARGSAVVAGDREVGSITSAAPLGPWALATLRRSVEPGAQVTVGGRGATVAAL